MRIELVVATKNRKKLEEIREILKGIDCRLTSLADYPKVPRILEDGKTFKENAVKKAMKIACFTRKLAIGEDSGLCVQALGGKPGINSARFAGSKKDDQANNRKLLRLLGDLPESKRKAYYVCAVALADEYGLIGVVEGRCSGVIGVEFRGSYGFGYDPLFVIPEHKKTFAELGPRTKHMISHRFRALEQARKLIEKYIERGQRR